MERFMSGKALIYAVDDELSIREVYQYALSTSGFEVCCFCDGEALSQALRERLPDLILLDIMLDGADGYEILQSLRKNPLTGAIPVIMVSAKGTEIDKVKGLDLGADDYLAKPFGVMELIARINANIRALSRNREKKLCWKDLTVDEAKHVISLKDVSLALTLKEYDLLKLLIANAGTVIARDKLLDSVWGENYGETRTLDIHIGQLRKALIGSEAGIETVRGVGYILK